jgi:uncharacterized protein (DUF1697 family)
MARFVALLRGINVGGKNKLPMKDLTRIFEGAGCADVRTYIQSGNVVFAAPASKGLAGRLEAAIAEQAGLRVPVVLRSARDYLAVAEANPFLARGADEALLHVAFLSGTPEPERVARLDPSRSPPDELEVVGMQVYLHFPAGLAKSKFTNAYLDSTLKVVSTVRNWRTVQALAGMLAA